MKLIYSFLFLFAFALQWSCSSKEKEAGVTATGNNGIAKTEIIITGNFDSTATAYVFSEEDPYHIIDTLKGNQKFRYKGIKDKSYRISVLSDKQGALSATLKNGDSSAVTLQDYTSKSLTLRSADSILSVQAEYFPPVVNSNNNFVLKFFGAQTNLRLQTKDASYDYSITLDSDKATLTPKSESLDLEITKDVLDPSIFKLRYTFDDWDGNIASIPSHSDGSAKLSAQLEAKATDLPQGRKALFFDKDVHFDTPISSPADGFSLLLVFKAEDANMGLFQFAVDDDISNATNWQGYIKDEELLIQANTASAQFTKIAIPTFKKTDWNYLLIQQSSKEGLQIWLNNTIAKSDPLKDFGQPTANNFHLGYSKRSFAIGQLAYFRGSVSEITFFTRSLKETEIKALPSW